MDLVDAELLGLLADFRKEADWRFSELTGDGYPVELLFDAATGFAGFTCEVAPVKATSRARLDRALAHAAPGVDARCRRLLAEVHGPGSGAGSVWLGGRAGPSGIRRKVYLTPERPLPLSGADAPWAHPSLSSPRLQMTAARLDSGALESYLSVDRLEPWHLEAQLGRCGLGDAWPRLGEAIEEAAGRRLPRALPGGRAGLSWTPGTLTLYLFARSAAGSDAVVRRAFLRLVEAMGGDPGPYAAVTRPVQDRRDPRTYHGMLAFAVSEGHLRVAVGLCPPPPAGP